MNGALRVLGRWIAESEAAHGKVALERARAALIDTIACMIVGTNADAAALARRTVEPWGTGRCSIVGRGKCAAPWAALVNGTAAHALDFDDNDTPAASHPSAVLFSTLIALAEERDLGGLAVLDAYIVGLEVMSRVGEAVNMSHYLRGWHATATLGALGATGACARLMGLDASRASTALSLATSMSAGFQCQFGTLAKPLHAGLAAKSGILSASLAESGITASMDALDGAGGLVTMMSDAAAPAFSSLEETLGNPLAIVQYGLSVKRYPCCYYCARAIDAVLGLRNERIFAVEKLERIDIQIPERNARIVAIEDPATPNEARFSLKYCVAVALIRGAVTIADFTSDGIRRTQMRALFPRIQIRPYVSSSFSADLSAREPDTVTICFKDGRTMTRTVAYARGSAHSPLSSGELNEKLKNCIQSAGVNVDADALHELLLSFATLSSVSPLTRLLQEH
jgi:2-methylcitrate dehydratase PrpD